MCLHINTTRSSLSTIHLPFQNYKKQSKSARENKTIFPKNLIISFKMNAFLLLHTVSRDFLKNHKHIPTPLFYHLQ